MTGFDLLGWIIIGLLAGSISGWFVGTRSVQGCLPTIVVGILGAIVGGWLTRALGNGPTEGFVGALALAIIGSIIVRIVLRAIEGDARP
ncbi:MAG: GlsB/YeaQ/YmgE family stress response membrane protein [Chloroflexi bacterium]|nr:MAG: GlsB/YeaQ/YmgE family stress response membrane protein [Chloroflexota bacterium]